MKIYRSNSTKVKIRVINIQSAIGLWTIVLHSWQYKECWQNTSQVETGDWFLWSARLWLKHAIEQELRDENHFISHATIAIVPLGLASCLVLNNAIDAKQGRVRTETYRLLPLCTMASSSTHQLRTFSTPNWSTIVWLWRHAELYLSIIPKLSTIQSNHSTKKIFIAQSRQNSKQKFQIEPCTVWY